MSQKAKGGWIWAAILTFICLLLVPLRFQHERAITPLLVFLLVCGTLMVALLLLAFFVNWRFLIGWSVCALGFLGYAVWYTALSLVQQLGLPDEAALALAPLLLIGLAWLFYWQTRSMFRPSIPQHLEFSPVVLASLRSRLNLEELETRTNSYLALGFQQALDFTSTGDVPAGVVLFGRLLIHPRHCCFAVLHQDSLPGAEPALTKHAIVSLLGENWRLCTSGAAPSLASGVRLPRELVQHWQGAAPAELLEWHLQRRRGMLENIPVSVCKDLTPEYYLERGRLWLTAFRRKTERTNRLVLLWRWRRASAQVKQEWLGEYRAILDARGES